MARAANVQMLSLFAEQIDALLGCVSRERDDRDRGHANQPLERRMQRLRVVGECGFHFGSTLSPIATAGGGFDGSNRSRHSALQIAIFTTNDETAGAHRSCEP